MEKNKKKNKLGIGILCSCAVLAAGYAGFKNLNLDNQQEVEYLENIVENLKEEYIPMKFKVDYKADRTAEVSIKYFDQDSRQVSRMSYIVNGTELFFDFKVIHLESDDAWLFFPYSIYSDKIEPSKGIVLYEDYTKDGIPLIYQGKNLNSSECGEFFKKIMSYATEGKAIEGADAEYGYSLHDMNDFDIHFLPDTTYRVVCHKQKGGIEFKAE